MEYEEAEKAQIFQDKAQWQTFVKTVIKISDSIKVGIICLITVNRKI
jgi:hypothetical protein